MECLEPGYTTGHEWKVAVPSRKADTGRRGSQQQLAGGDVGGVRGLRGGAGSTAGGACSRGAPVGAVCSRPPLPAPAPPALLRADTPFMNEMDEISFWVYTKKAPCLFNYDNPIKRQYEALQISKQLNDGEGAPSPKKKKRKLSLLDDDCVSVDKQQNQFFESSRQKPRTVPSSCKSGTLESDIDFNIKNSSVQNKPKKIKKQKSNRTLHKKNKVVTSTPLRRSQRRVLNGTGDSQQLNISFGTYNCSYLNDIIDQSNCKNDSKPGLRPKKSSNKLDVSLEKKNSVLPDKLKPETTPKQQFEDLSDVSGFTANYIRSTKLHSSAKPHRSLRSKCSRNLVKESQPNVTDTQIPKSTTMLVCMNKAVNATGDLPNTTMLNCSTDSSQNVINLVTTKANDTSCKVNKSTSLLKFVDLKTSKPKGKNSLMKTESQEVCRSELDTSFPSKSVGTSRYPKRHKKNMVSLTRPSNTLMQVSLDKRKKVYKVAEEMNNSERKENPDTSTVSRTRSGRNSTLALRQPENSVIVYSNSTEKDSTVNTLNVASKLFIKNKSKMKRRSSHKNSFHLNNGVDSETVVQRDSLRERSGFAACFSDSDDDSDALKQRKFFC